MTEKNEKLKPPARRTGGRTLGAARKTTPPPPPPAAELTPEQATTPVTDQASENALQADSAVASAPVRAYAVTDVAVADTAPIAAPTAAADRSSGAVREAAKGQSLQEAGTTPEPNPVTVEESVAPTDKHGEQPAVQGHPASEVPGTAPAAEVAVRPATSAVAGGTAFPVQGAELIPEHHQGTQSSEAPTESAPWAQGPGRPGDIPALAVLLNQRVIARESFDSSVPAALKLKRRIKRFALDNELDHLPIGDFVAVAMDEWLTTRGF
ncbi:hypothetical protein G5C60_04765 [Streptomyces sp. HC44]|uniref:Uncharacterized protein n=1 Tax=Streptomyces scabichelini TaxID=2711217 RepID=A0A6G4UZC7_9ACTN|nr:hypothetical protein [Streptomyces scabichelini]NGO06983.1 hypothetical protein [Streptomyces scabichelini]